MSAFLTAAYLNKWLAKKSVATRNKLIVDLLATKAKTAITGIDDVKNVMNVTLDPAISAMSEVVMNQDAFNKFDKMKDTDGNYLLQRDPANPTQKLLCGHPVKVYSNKTLPTRTADTSEISFSRTDLGSLRCLLIFFAKFIWHYEINRFRIISVTSARLLLQSVDKKVTSSLGSKSHHLSFRSKEINSSSTKFAHQALGFPTTGSKIFYLVDICNKFTTVKQQLQPSNCKQQKENHYEN